tara:strand:- start:21349 stop:21855 length:507 start_codon:yes stop_codon:yes gene_type:complete
MKNNLLKPTWDSNQAIHNIQIKDLINRNIKGLILDVDGTLLPGKDVELHESVKVWISNAQKHLLVYLLSNNPSKKRIRKIANEFNMSFTYRASKPFKGAILKAINEFECDMNNIALIGDRLFTDILGGNRAGLYTILVKPLDSNGFPCKKNYTQKIEKYISKLIGGYK